jgi:Transposase DDE domain
MERERWERVYRLLVQLDKREVRGVFRDAIILAVYFWAVIHDRPVSWACRASHWPSDLRKPLPSQSTMSRRLRTASVQALLNSAGDAEPVAGNGSDAWVKVVDAKPLPVGGHSKAPDARWGQGVRSLMKGYKLFAIWGNGWMPLAWRIGAMNTSEQSMAQQMIPELQGRTGYLLGDKLYDINKLYDAAQAVAHQLVADRKRPRAGLGHRKHSPARLRAIELLRGSFGRALYHERDHIERNFGGLTNFGGGLTPLPNWVRRLTRVRQWIHAKLIVNALRLQSLSLTAVA